MPFLILKAPAGMIQQEEGRPTNSSKQQNGAYAPPFPGQQQNSVAPKQPPAWQEKQPEQEVDVSQVRSLSWQPALQGLGAGGAWQ